jgi:hypothetical protein
VSVPEIKFNELVSNGIKKAINKFREHPRIFFSEMDIHSYLYFCLYSTRFEVKTSDGVITSCLHKEYPTNFRYSKETMEDYGFEQKGVRGHFDFAILNPQFVKDFSIKNIMNKDIRDTEARYKFNRDTEARSRNANIFRNELLTAIELKYVTNNSMKFIEEVKKDTEKLSLGLKYQSFEAYNLVFCNCKYYYIDKLVELIETTESKIKNILVRTCYTNDKKETPKPITNGWNF